MWIADLLAYRGEKNFIRAFQGDVLVWERPVKNNVIYYTTYSENITIPNNSDFGGAVIVSNTYEDGLGVMKFDRSVTKIGERAFLADRQLISIIIPSSVTTIDVMAFGQCDELTYVEIPTSVTHINGSAFVSCTALETVTIPSSVVYIGGAAFLGCTSLVEVIVNPQTPPELYYNSATAEYTSFKDNASGRLFKVPVGKVNTYKTAPGWSDYALDIVSQ